MNNETLQVILQKCDRYDRFAIAAHVEMVADRLGGFGPLYGTTVLLKPNLISSSRTPCVCTHSEFIAGVTSWFLDQGARVFLGDSPAFGKTGKVCHALGIVEGLRGMDVRFVDFVTPVKKKLAGGVTVPVAREALECDLFVNMPKIKAHNQMFVSLAVKNIFGIVKGANKAKLHMVHGASHEQFSAVILDLLSVLPPQLHLADGIEAMHRSGPLDGCSLPLNCMAAARCPVALDTAILDLLELDLRKSPLWLLASKRMMAGSDRRNITYPLLSPEDFQNSGFIAPGHLNGIRFHPARFLGGMVKRVFLRVCR